MELSDRDWFLIGGLAVCILLFIMLAVMSMMREKERKPLIICGVCGNPGTGARPGSNGTEVFLWLIGILPGLLYHLWRARERCPKCGSEQLVPYDSPRGQKLKREFLTE